MKLRLPSWLPAVLWITLVVGVSCWMHVRTSTVVALKPNTEALDSLSAEVKPVTAFTAPERTEESSTPSLSETEIVVEEEEVLVLDETVSTSQAGASVVIEEEYVPEVLPEPESLVSDALGSLPVKDWDPREFEHLAAPDYETTDMLSAVSAGATIIPPQMLSVEELLAANRPEEPIGYGHPLYYPGTPFRLGTGTPGVPPIPAALPDGKIHIESTDYIDYDEEHNQVYGQGRITLRYGAYKLEGDRVMVDTRLREVQAYGNVTLTGPNEFVEGQSLWFDLDNYQGVSYESRGRMGDFFVLQGDPHDHHHGTTIRQVSRSETVLKDSSFTMCEFPVPHYRLRAKEFTIIANERIFARNVVLYVLECPVLWLPFFTRAFDDQNPLGITAGSDSELGLFVRLFYDFKHACYTPSDVDDNLMIKSSDGRGRLRLDYFSKRGLGKGLFYDYFFDYGRHFGDLEVYQINDGERSVDADDSDRYYVDWWHRSRITEELDFLADVNYTSDPDIFYDILDRVRSSSEREHGRLPERHAQFGLEWTTDDWFAGLQVELKDRIGRNRVTNFADPRDNDFDYDRAYNNERFISGAGGIFSDPASIDDTLEDGVASSRYGRASQRMPQLTISSNRLRLWCLPLWYHVDLNVFNNLDKGLNVVSSRDDSFVQGFDLYQSLSHLQKFSDRYTLLTKFGLGLGVAEREDDTFNLNFPAGATFPFVYEGQMIDGKVSGVRFADEDTFYVGKRRMSLSEVDPAFVYGDIDSRFNARISECTTAWIRYRFREGTDNLGTFYEQIGSRKTMDDLYAFRTPEHWIETGLSYALHHPRLTLNASTGRNLQGEGQITPGELLNYSNLGVAYHNIANTLFMNAGVGLQDRQMRDPTDPFEFQQNSLTYYLSGSYLPVHQRYWTRLSAFMIQNNEADPRFAGGARRFDTRNETVLDWTVGRKIGPKYMVEFRSRLKSRADESQDTYVRIERDFHDMVAGISLGVRSEDELSSKDETTRQDNFQVRFNVRIKPSSDKGVTPVSSSRRLYTADRPNAFDRSGI